MNRRTLNLFTFTALVLLLAAGGPALAQHELKALEEQVHRGRRHLQEFEFGAALSAFEGVVAASERGQLDLTLPGARRLLTSALEGMAEAHLSIGNPDAAAEQFVAALVVSPAFEPDRERNSPKLIAIFDSVRDRSIGYMDINVRPFGARVEINGAFVGETPLLSVPWPSGTLEIVIEHPGRAASAHRVALEAGGRLTLDEQLATNARSVSFITAPTDVRIFVDGLERAVSQGPGSHEMAREHNINPTQLSGETLVEHLTPGVHTVRFQRDCFASQDLRIDVELDPDGKHMRVPLVILQRSTGTLEVASTPWGGRVRLDGKDQGETPLTLRDVCSGTHDLEVVGMPRGRWSARVDLRAGETKRVLAPLRPGLAFLGLASGPDVSADMLQEARTQVNNAVARMNRYHRILPDLSEGLKMGRALLPGPDGRAPQVRVETVRDVALPLNADLVLVGQVRVERLRPVVDLLLYSTLHGSPDVVTIRLYETEAMERFVTSLSRRPRLEEPWFGLRAAGTRTSAHPVVVELYHAGPAGDAGVRVGDALVALNGNTLNSFAEWRRALQKLRSGDQPDKMPMTLTVRRDGADEQIHMDVSWAPEVLGPGRPDVLYNQQLVDLEYEAGGHSNDYSRGVVRLNQAMAFIHFGRYDLALQQSLAKARLPEGQGISRGTVEYLRGWCYEQLGPEYHPEAREAFAAAAAADGATLATHMGPQVAPLAEQHLESLR
ncbi:MAG: PEGA domain-containing protein [Acidobacteria bacterium]|nr:MAG: PEGA domain-containing protein [Acidobacteriota bacterium]